MWFGELMENVKGFAAVREKAQFKTIVRKYLGRAVNQKSNQLQKPSF